MPPSDSKTEESNQTNSWESALGAAIALTIITSLALVAAGGWDWFKGMLESAAPAWIQAIGSVAAIVAAAIIARRQAQSAIDLEAHKLAASETQKFLIIKALMVRAYGLSNDICRAFETKLHEDFDQVSPELMLDTHQALITLPVFEIPNGFLALDVLTVGRAIGTIHEHWLTLCKEASNEAQTLTDHIGLLVSLAEEVREISMAAVTECKKEIEKRGYSQDGTLVRKDG